MPRERSKFSPWQKGSVQNGLSFWAMESMVTLVKESQWRRTAASLLLHLPIMITAVDRSFCLNCSMNFGSRSQRLRDWAQELILPSIAWAVPWLMMGRFSARIVYTKQAQMASSKSLRLLPPHLWLRLLPLLLPWIPMLHMQISWELVHRYVMQPEAFKELLIVGGIEILQ